MREPRIIATLIRQSTGERVLAKEKTALQEIEKLQEQIEKKKQEALDELTGDLREARKVVKDIEDQIAELSGKKTRKSGGRVCAVCGESGHNSRRHTAAEIAEAKKRKKKAEG